MRIAMISRWLPRSNYAGGVSGQVHLLATELVRRGHDVHVFGLSPAPPGALYSARVVRETGTTRAARVVSHYVFPWWLRKIRFDEYDVIHGHGDDYLVPRRPPLVRTFYGSALGEALSSRRPRQCLYYSSMVLAEAVSALRASAVVAISATTSRHVPRVTAVIPCGVDLQMFVPGASKTPHPTILFVGEPWTRKRGELLAEVFAREVRPALPAAELWMVGARGITGDGIRWSGLVSGAELVTLYQRAWVFCMPSRYEGFGVPYLEAMACGTPVVSTPNGGAREVLADGRFGVIVPDGNLGAALLGLLRSPSARIESGQRGLDHARHYDIANVCAQYEAIYRTVIANGGHRPR